MEDYRGMGWCFAVGASASVRQVHAEGAQKPLGDWRNLARETAWKDYANKNENCARLIKLAMEAGA